MPRLPLLVLLLLGLLAGPLAPRARAQCVPDLPPPGCTADQVFVALSNGVPVSALCVGQQVTLLPGACRGMVNDRSLYYQTLPATQGSTNTSCTFVGLPSAAAGGNVYTPTAAGFVTISELYIAPGGGAASTLYSRNFQVFEAAQFTFELAACQGGTALVRVPSRAYTQYQVQVGGVNVATVPPQTDVIIPAPAGSPVTVRGVVAGNTRCFYETSQPVPTLPAATAPVFARLTTAGPLPGSLALEVSNLQAGYFYDIERASPAAPAVYQVVGAVPAGTTTYTLPGAPAGSYRLRQRDACQTVLNASAPLPTLELSGTSLNNVNTLSWQAGGPVAGYTLLRATASGGFQPLPPLPASATTYTDRDVSCGTRYTYRLQATGPGGGQAVSNDAAVLTVSALAPPAPLLLASFDLTNRLTLTATLPGGVALPAGSTVVYSRQGGPGSLEFAPVPAATDTLRDPAPLPELQANPPCYAAAVQDVCGNRSALGATVCPTLLMAEPADADGRTTRLSWTAFRGPGSPAAPASYRVLTLAANGTVLAASAATTALTYFDGSPPADRQVLRYRVEVSGAGLPNGRYSYSNLATVTRRPLLAIPNAFTPNGDGLNDVLEVKGRYLSAFTFVVVDRNGQEVFRATDRSQTWDGTIQGHPPVNAPYVWRFTMTDEAGQAFSQTGSVSILK